MSKNYTITTLGSHSALQILKGAKNEGFKTLLVTTVERVSFYQQFAFIDKIITLKSFSDFPQLEKKLNGQKIIIIPHGSFVAYLGVDGNKKITLPYFGNKKVLDWEANRNKQHLWLEKAQVNLPEQYDSIDKVSTYPVIVKSFGAAGGSGYFFAKNKTELQEKLESKFKHSVILGSVATPESNKDRFWTSQNDDRFVIQQYIIGVTAYFHYFYSPLTKKLEIMSMDRRYETNVDAIGRIPINQQEELSIDPSFVVVGNSPLVLRESLLPEVNALGERIIAASKKLIDDKGLYGPFCLETIITPEQKIYAIEISCRIVAGTNLFINGSPYSWLNYNEPMSTGRRVAREIKQAIKEHKINLILD